MPIQAEANLSALIESSDDPIWSVDLQYRLVTFNTALQRFAEQHFGVRPPEGVAGAHSDPEVSAEFWTPLYDRALAEGPYRFELQVSTGGTFELAFNPIIVAGKPAGVSVFAKDIGHRKKAEDALRAAEKRYRELFDGAIEGMFEALIGNGLRSVNYALAEMLGYESPTELTAAMMADPEALWTKRSEQEMFTSLLRNHGSVHNFECELRRKDGTDMWVALSSRIVLDGEGKPIAHRGCVKDITSRREAETRLRNSEEQLRATFEQAAIGILHVSFDGEILACNPRFASIVGYSQSELVGMSVRQMTPPEFLAICEVYFTLLREDPTRSASWEKEYLRKDGRRTWVRLAVSVQNNGEGHPLHHIAFVQDIHAEKMAEQALAEASKALQTSEARYRTVFQTIVDGVAISRVEDGMFIEVNEAFLRNSGFAREEVLGRTALELNIWDNPNDRPKIAEMLALGSSFRDMEVRFRRKSGETYWGLLSASVIDVDGVPFVLSVTRDISDVKAAEDRIRDLAFYDPLTRLPNRRLMLDRLRQALTSRARNPRRLALLFIDLDNFKILNDTLGHQTGDLLLQEAAQRLTGSVRESDTVARLGGDEFVVMLDGLSEVQETAAAQAKLVGEKILAALGTTYVLSGRELRSQLSMGITVFGTPHRNPDEILQQAEIAMYQAKAAGRGAIRFFSPKLQAVVNERVRLEEDLREAIKAEQFELYYQPQVDSSGLIGAEALIRWNHPSRGILPPGEFIPLAEETGLILELGDWTLEHASLQLAAWARRWERMSITVAVNISARQFRQVDFVERVLDGLRRTGANPMTLKLELTESMLVDDIEDVIAKMTELRAHGLSFSLDDFGTGYSSLSYLKRLPLDQLKIDRAFIRDILVDVSSGAIAQTIISLGKAMGLSVIAEGVETEGQRDLLVGLGCSSFQGYLYSRALRVEDFERRWLVPASLGFSVAN